MSNPLDLTPVSDQNLSAKLVYLVLQNADEPQTTTEIKGQIKVTMNTVRTALRALRDEDMVVSYYPPDSPMTPVYKLSEDSEVRSGDEMESNVTSR